MNNIYRSQEREKFTMCTLVVTSFVNQAVNVVINEHIVKLEMYILI